MLRRSITSLVVSSSLVAAAVVVLGPPDVGTASAFFAGGTPTLAEGQAVAGLLAWVVIAAVVATLMLTSFSLLRGWNAARHAKTRAVLACIAGVVLLLSSVIGRTLDQAPAFCCGGTHAAVQEALNLAH